ASAARSDHKPARIAGGPCPFPISQRSATPASNAAPGRLSLKFGPIDGRAGKSLRGSLGAEVSHGADQRSTDWCRFGRDFRLLVPRSGYQARSFTQDLDVVGGNLWTDCASCLGVAAEKKLKRKLRQAASQ